MDTRRGRRLALVAAAACLTVALAGALLVGYVVGRRSTDADWLTGDAYVGAGQEASVETDGWTYGLSRSVAWLGQFGSYHETGWPRCLDVRAGSRVTTRFAAVPVQVEGMEWREVVLVDCSWSTD